MRVGPVVRPQEERHVRFHPIVQVRVYDQEGPINLQPTHDALRLERQIRNMPLAEPRVVPPIEIEQRPNKAVRCYKNTCHAISVVCGVAVIPSFACVAFGLVGFVVPAALLSACIIAHCIGGRETDGFRDCIDDVHADVESHDFR